MPKTKNRDGMFSVALIVWIVAYYGLHDKAESFLDMVVKPLLR